MPKPTTSGKAEKMDLTRLLKTTNLAPAPVESQASENNYYKHHKLQPRNHSSPELYPRLSTAKEELGKLNTLLSMRLSVRAAHHAKAER